MDTIDIAVELMNVIAESIILLYFFRCMYPKRAASGCVAACAYAIYTVILAVLSLVPANAYIRLGYSIIAAFLICRVVYHGGMLNAIYVTLALNIMVVLADALCVAVFSLFGVNTQALTYGGSQRTLSIVVAKLIVLIFIQLLTRIIRRNAEDCPTWTIPLVLGQALSILIVGIFFDISISTQIKAWYNFIVSGGTLYTNLVICFYVESLKSSLDNKRQRELAEQQLQIQLDYLEKELKEQTETRALWHDIKKYMNAMQSLIEHDDREEAVQCLSQANAAISEIHKTVDVGNAVVNGILEHALAQTRHTVIVFDLDIWLPEKLPITAVDLNIIMGNTIDNAIEACRAILDPVTPIIKIVLKQQGQILYYEISNPKAKAVRTHAPRKRVHGYGLPNVRQCVKKYGGDIVVDSEGDVFRVVIKLPFGAKP